MDSLKFTSALSMCLSFMFISITLSLVGDRLLYGGIGHVNWLPAADVSAGDVLKTLPVMMTAYVCHYNVHPIFAEMAAPSERRMRRVVAAALQLCSAVYWLVGVAAYLLFTDRTQDDVLMNFGRDLDMARGEAWVEHAVKIGYALSLSCTFPLIQFSLRQSVFDLAGWGDAREQPTRFYAVTVRVLACHLAACAAAHARECMRRRCCWPRSTCWPCWSPTSASHSACSAPPSPSSSARARSRRARAPRRGSLTLPRFVTGFILPALVALYGTETHRRWGGFLLAAGVAVGASSFSATVYGLVAPK